MLKAEFYDVISAAIPSFIELLQSEDNDGPYWAASILSKLAENGELRANKLATCLMYVQSWIS